MKPLLRFFAVSTLFLFAPQSLHAFEATLEEQLEEAYLHPREFYFEHVQKYDASGNPIDRPNPFFEQAGITESEFLDLKIHNRGFIGRGVRDTGHKMLVAIGENDRPEGLTDNGADLVRSIVKLDQMGLKEAKLPNTPWSGDYWAVYKGVLGFRFLDINFPVSDDWSILFKYITDFPFLTIFSSGEASKIQTLSPSEKYDLLVGDLQGTLTQNMWGQGKEYYDSEGKVETWMGICHGWAAAAVNVERPARQVKLTAYDGKTELAMNPSEIKGLISYLWSNTPYATRFIGGRCNVRDVPRDPNGRPLDPTCLDTNAGTWHLAVTNQIGISRRGFVMDATPDFEVWNQPVYAYKIKYFNPMTRKESETLNDAIVRREDFKEDRFLDYRSPKTVYITGVEMEVHFISEESANDRTEDLEEYDSIRRVRYIYDLELDANKNIIGGEWYKHEHPDFLWVPYKGAKPITYEDRLLAGTTWDISTPTPDNWREAAQWASQSGRVLSSIVENIWKNARKD